MGTPTHASEDDHLPVYYATINLLHYLRDEENVVSVSVVQTGETDDFMVGRGRRRHRATRSDGGGAGIGRDEPHLLAPEADLEARGLGSGPHHHPARPGRPTRSGWSDEAGDHARIVDTMDEYFEHSPEGAFGHYLMMLGAVGGRDCTARASSSPITRTPPGPARSMSGSIDPKVVGSADIGTGAARGTILGAVDEPTRDDLADDLEYLASSLETLPIADVAENDRLIARRDWIIRTIRDYLIPRMGDPIASDRGFRRPHRRRQVDPPQLGHRGSPCAGRPASTDHQGPIGPLLRGEGGRLPAHRRCRLRRRDRPRPILEELILVDTPDIDSTSVEHRAMAETMIDNADIVVYVSSALRYADLVPWEVLRRAH